MFVQGHVSYKHGQNIITVHFRDEPKSSSVPEYVIVYVTAMPINIISDFVPRYLLLCFFVSAYLKLSPCYETISNTMFLTLKIMVSISHSLFMDEKLNIVFNSCGLNSVCTSCMKSLTSNIKCDKVINEFLNIKIILNCKIITELSNFLTAYNIITTWQRLEVDF